MLSNYPGHATQVAASCPAADLGVIQVAASQPMPATVVTAAQQDAVQSLSSCNWTVCPASVKQSDPKFMISQDAQKL